MMRFRYSSEKNATLLEQRGVGFEEIIQAITDGNLLEVKSHYNQHLYPNQDLLYVRIIDEVYVVPCIIEDNESVFLKTLFPSRKARKQLLKE